MAILTSSSPTSASRSTSETVPPANIVTDISSGKYPAAFFFLFQGEPWVAINQMISTTLCTTRSTRRPRSCRR